MKIPPIYISNLLIFQNSADKHSLIILREFLSMIIIFLSVLVWYFLSQVSAQLLKVRLKCIFFKYCYRTDAKSKETRSVSPPVAYSTCNRSCTCCFQNLQNTSGTHVFSNHDNISDASSVDCNDVEHTADDAISIINNNHVTTNKSSHVMNNNIESYSPSSSSSSSYSEMDGSVNNSTNNNTKLHHSDIPSIIITPVAQSSFKGDQLTVTNSEHVYDSGKGSSEITGIFQSHYHPPSPSPSTATLDLSGVFSTHNGDIPDILPPRRCSDTLPLKRKSRFFRRADKVHPIRAARSLHDFRMITDSLRTNPELLSRSKLDKSNISISSVQDIQSDVFGEIH